MKPPMKLLPRISNTHKIIQLTLNRPYLTLNSGAVVGASDQ